MDNEATEYVISERDFQLKRLEEIRTALADARSTGNWSQVPADVYLEYLSKIIVTASSSVVGKTISKQIDFVSAESIFSTEMSENMMDSRQEKIVEQGFQNARLKVMQQLRAQALRCSADGITDVELKHTLIDSHQLVKRFLIVATGTAVQLKNG